LAVTVMSIQAARRFPLPILLYARWRGLLRMRS
jgi:hypothetical protein